MDLLPTYERERMRRKLRSPEAYAETREKVKSPEQIEEEMRQNDRLAQLRFGLETEPKLKNALKEQIKRDCGERGAEAMLAHADISPDARRAIENGDFDIVIDAPDERGDDQIILAPSGNVSERLALKKSVSDRYVSQFSMSL